MDRSLQRIDSYTGHTAAVYALAKGTAENEILSAGGDGSVVAWQPVDPVNGRLIAKVGEAIFSLFVDQERQMLLVGAGSGRLHVIDLASKAEIQIVELHRKGIFAILGHMPGRLLCAGGDGILSAWRWAVQAEGQKLELERQIPLCEEKLRDLALSPTGDRIAVACGDGTVREFEPKLLNETMRLELHEGGATCVAYHPNKPVLISGGKDGQLRFWHTHDGGRSIHSFAAHKGSIYAATIDHSGKWLATVGRDSLIKVWDADDLSPVHRTTRDRTGHTHSVNAALWTGSSLFTASDDRSVKELVFA